MKNLLKIIFTKPTLFSIVGLVLVVIGLPYGTHGLNQNGGSSLGGVIILMFVFLAIIIFIFDRIAVQKIGAKKLNIIEIILAAVFTSIFSFRDRKVIFDISQNETDYFVIMENNGK